MGIAETIISIILIIGITYILYIILRDPILMFKTFLRALKGGGNISTVILFPIWGTIWLLDKIFNLNLYIKEFEEASKPQKIINTEYDVYIQVNTTDIKYIKKVLESYIEDNKSKFSEKINNHFSFYKIDNNIIIEGSSQIQIRYLYKLIFYINNSAPLNKLYNAKGILINTIQLSKSFFVFFDDAFPSKLIGKTYKNKKIYLANNAEDILYYNSNIDYFNNFAFNKFKKDIKKASKIGSL